MITFVIVAGLTFLVLAALVVGIFDTVHAVDRRETAAERRDKWEARVLELHGGVMPAEDWDDSSWDDD